MSSGSGPEIGAPAGDDPVDVLSRALGYEFRDRERMFVALSHASYAHETRGDRGNERLEFLGDAVLDLVVGEALYAAHPDWSEGELTRAGAPLVRGAARPARAAERGPAHARARPAGARRRTRRARARARAAEPRQARAHRGAIGRLREGFDPRERVRGGDRCALSRRE